MTYFEKVNPAETINAAFPKLYLDGSLEKDLEYYTYKGYCVGTYDSHYSNGKYWNYGHAVTILFSKDNLEVVIRPFSGCSSLMETVQSLCNCVAGEDDENVRLELEEGEELKNIVEDYLSSKYSDDEVMDIYGDDGELRCGKHYKFIETEGYANYVEVHKI